MADSASRAKNSILGALVADAATMPLHWIYSEEKITAAMGDKVDKPEFFNPPSCPYYSTEAHPGHYALGQVSPYGEEMLCLTGHMTKNNGDFKSGEAFADDLLAWAESFKGRPNSCTKKFLEQRKEGKKYPECGADDSQANSLIKAMVVTARYYGKPELYDKVEEAIRTHQDNDMAVLYGQAAARILERVILGESIQQVLTKLDDGIEEEVSGAIKFAMENKSKPTWEFITLLGERVKLQPVYATSCALPGAFILPLYLLANHSTFEEGVRANIRIGGDNCSRSMFLGAVLAAGTGNAPSDWKAKVKDFAEYEKIADVIVKART